METPDLHRKLDRMQEDLSDIKSEIAVLKEWKKTVKIYTYSVWALLVGFVAKALGIHDP